MQEDRRDERILVTVTGRDHPGITAALTRIVAERGAALLDLQQVVVQGRLDLAVLVGVGNGGSAAVLQDLQDAAKQHGCDFDFRVVEAETPAPRLPYVLTLLGDPELDARAVAGIARVLAEHAVNIEKIQRLSESCLATLELTIGIPDEEAARTVRGALVRAAAALDVDVALQPEGLFRRAKRLVVFDLDSTLVRGETLVWLAERAGVGERVAEVTRRAMNGELDFAAALRERLALLAGLPAGVLDEAARAAEPMPGAAELVGALRRLGFETAIVSGGLAPIATALRQRLGIDWSFANEVEIVDGRLTGRVQEPILDAAAKARILRELAGRRRIALDQVIAVGDGANDLPMLELAGLGIAFNAHAAVRAQARHHLNRPRLDSILFLLGISERDIRSLQRPEGA